MFCRVGGLTRCNESRTVSNGQSDIACKAAPNGIRHAAHAKANAKVQSVWSEQA